MKKILMIVAAGLLALGLAHTEASAATVTFSSASGTTTSSSTSQQLNLPGALSNNWELDFTAAPTSPGSFNYSWSLCTTASCTPANSVLDSVGSAISSGLVSLNQALAAGTYYFSYALNTLSAPSVHWTFDLKYTTAAAPIPPSLLLFVTALGGLGFVGFRRKGFSF